MLRLLSFFASSNSLFSKKNRGTTSQVIATSFGTKVIEQNIPNLNSFPMEPFQKVLNSYSFMPKFHLSLIHHYFHYSGEQKWELPFITKAH
jgi:hypothetical protein